MQSHRQLRPTENYCRPWVTYSRVARKGLSLFLDSNTEGLQEPLVLSGEPDLAERRNLSRVNSCGTSHSFAVFPLIESNCGFKNEKYVVAGAFNRSDRLGNGLRIGKRLVDRVSQILDQALDMFFQVRPPFRELPNVSYLLRCKFGAKRSPNIFIPGFLDCTGESRRVQPRISQTYIQCLPPASAPGRMELWITTSCARRDESPGGWPATQAGSGCRPSATPAPSLST